VTVVSCDSPNNNLYHQRVTEANRRDTSRAINVDDVRVSSEPPSRRPSASTSTTNEVVEIDSHETSHSSIAESLHNLVTMLYKIFFFLLTPRARSVILAWPCGVSSSRKKMVFATGLGHARSPAKSWLRPKLRGSLLGPDHFLQQPG
jgi:hypothetical protein